jgi:hypothetical protein
MMRVGWTQRALKSLQDLQLSVEQETEVRAAAHLLAGMVEGQLNLHGLDIRRIQGTRDAWWRLKFRVDGIKLRVMYRAANGVVAIGFVAVRTESMYDQVRPILNNTVLSRSGDGLRFFEVPEVGQIGVLEGIERRDKRSAARPRERENPLTPMSSSQLLQMGLGASTIELVRTLGPEIDIAEALASRGVAAEEIELVLGVWTAPELAYAALEQGRIPTREDVVIGDEEFALRAASSDSSLSLAELADDDFRTALDGPIDAWMFFLHPRQTRMVEARPNGPRRVRGGPGTGKTVVGLHRAKWLVRNGHASTVLMTTFTNVLPRVWDELLADFAPREADSITCCTIDKLARDIVAAAGGVVDVADPQETRILRSNALQMIGASDVLDPMTFGEEIDFLIAGRMLDADGYFAIERRGREKPLNKTERQKVWAAYQQYLSLLAKKRKTDWAHLRAEALGYARAGRGPRFDAIIVDEAQDLTEAHLNLVLALDKDIDHKQLMLVGDGQQRIYPGGYSLGSVGIDVRGRSEVLRTNWRNTQFIMDAAGEVIGDLPFGDLDEPERIHRGADTMPLPTRLGDPVELWIADDLVHSMSITRDLVEDLLTRYEPNDIAVLARTNREVQSVMAMLRPLPVRAVTQDWQHEDGVTVATQARSKGLEFKAVVLLKIEAGSLDDAIAKHAVREDAIATWTRTMFVAMTRARDELYLVGVEPLAEPFENARTEAAFDVV